MEKAGVVLFGGGGRGEGGAAGLGGGGGGDAVEGVEEVVRGVRADLGAAVGVLVVEDGICSETLDEFVVAGGAGCDDRQAGTW